MEYKQEIKNCQNCKKDFTIEPEDFNFYEKIKVPPPTFCPKCRLLRRMANTNERVLYKRKCDLTGESILSMFPEDALFPVYKSEAWYSDDWDSYKYGIDYDFSKPFFKQFGELLKKVPRMALVKQGFSRDSEYTHRVHDMKDSYMVFRMSGSENSLYCYVGRNIVNCVDCISVWDCELCYECIDCNNCYKVRFSQESHDCRDSFFLYACRNCSDCVGCINLINQSYCIFNKKYEKEEYKQKLKELKLNSISGIKNFEKQFLEFKNGFPFRSIHSLKSNNISGNWIVNCQNVKDSFGCISVKDGKYLFWIFNAEDCMDYFQWGKGAELIYESENVGINVSRIKFSSQCWMGAHDLSYCDSCPGASDCFGCIGLKKGEYSILNKKYTKEEYEALLPKIIKHMEDMPYIDEKGVVYKYGENFPIELSPFAYNETAALDFFSFSKTEVEKLGYRWKEKEKKNYEITVKGGDLPETIGEVNDEILNEIIECAEKDKIYSVGAYKITQNELSFYRRMDLPLPRVCFDVRHTRRLAKRPLPVLHNRTCKKCSIEVETIYTEAFAPIVYCEKCYQQEVY
ncbi:hypothetical protein A2121_02520 [Candidatus Nomurabacteria bacterium GWB1_40_6]|uniref:Uncharacterized protein n=1 Tax=Candidatus Nomurabacteria bacterium GWB1_40_6 TaxID=1801727 RepID=A0A1F6TLZ3_9BACT|nr:MAG: hypothetical protein A2121_02520 [Candidatus Nomurabacteria bacterium GWB1_40_6]